MEENVDALDNRVGRVGVLNCLKGGEGVGKKKKFVGGGKQREVSEARINSREFSRINRGRISHAEVGNFSIDGEGVACSGSRLGSICKAQAMGRKVI